MYHAQWFLCPMPLLSREECEKDILITGRRMDQAAQRIKLDVWEDQKRTWARL